MAVDSMHLPPFEILDPGHAFLGIGHHFAEEVGEAGTAELAGAGPVEIPVVDCFAIGGSPETGGRVCALERPYWRAFVVLRGIHHEIEIE